VSGLIVVAQFALFLLIGVGACGEREAAVGS
jgi:hypothetical protein